MKNRIPRKYFFAPFLFLLVSFFFLAQHFIKTERFSGVVGNINYIGSKTLGSRLSPPETRSLNVFFNGIDFIFSPLSKLIITTSDGIEHSLDLEEFSTGNDRITLDFENNVSLIFISDIHSKKVTLLPNLPLTIPPINEVILPAGTFEGFRLEQERDKDLNKLTNGDENYFLTIPSDTVMDLEENRIFLNVSNNIIKSIVLEETLSGSGRSLLDWYEKEGALLSSTIYKTSLNQFMDRVIQSLQNHLDTREGLITRTDAEGTSYFSEQALTSFVIGSIPKGQYNSVVSMLQTGASRQASQMTVLSSPFFDDIVNKGNALIVEDWKKGQTYEDQLTAENPDILKQRGLVNYFDTQFNLYKKEEDLFFLAVKNIDEAEDFSSLLGRFEIILDYLKMNPEENFPQAITTLIDILQERTFWIKDDLLLFNDQGIAELEFTLEYGKLLTTYADILDDDQLQASGWKFILSCLKYGDINGYIPKRIVYTDQAEPDREGIIPPEQLYTLLNDSRYNPRRESLRKQLGAGSWTFTASSKLTVKSTPRETVINVDFPIGSEHYFMIKGIPPFTELHMHEIRWKSDKSFQRYSDGWLYDAAKNTLYVKIKHRRATETIKILHYDPNATKTDEKNPSIQNASSNVSLNRETGGES